MKQKDSKLTHVKRRVAGSVLLFLLLTVNSFGLYAQQNPRGSIEVKGFVTNVEGSGLSGATVAVKDAPTGAVTGENGEFTISVAPDATLVVSYLGYVTRDVGVDNNPSPNIALSQDPKSIDEVVVIGYGMARKSDLTGAISSVSGSELSQSGNSTVAQMLKGQIPGLSFSQTSNQPGGAVWMNIRGTAAGASPLIIVDGIPVSTMWEPNGDLFYGKGDKESVLDNINPDDIKDIQVLKDASATSIYGSRAAGGVILITTKRGLEGSKPIVSLKSSYTAQWITESPEVMGAQDYMRQSNKARLEKWVREQGYYPWGINELPSGDELIRLYEEANSGLPGKGWNYDPAAIDQFPGGTDWMREITRIGGIQEYDLSVAGGGNSNAYLISGSHMMNKGVLKKNNYGRTTGRVNFDQEFNSWLKAGVTVNYSLVRSNDPPLSSREHGTIDLFSQARGFDPVVPVRDYNGEYTYSEIKRSNRNPVAQLDIEMLTKKENLLSSAYIDIKPIEELTIKTTVGYDRKFASLEFYAPSYTQRGDAYDGVGSITKHEQANYYINVMASYNKTFAENHDLGAMVGWEYQNENFSGVNAENRGFAYDAVKWYNLAMGTYEKPIVRSFNNTSQNASLIARLNYSFKDRYLLTANFRRDGSSNFAPNKQWGNFGGVSVAWRISEEEFLKDVSWITNLKLRAGTGVTGYAGSLTGTATYYTAGWDYYVNNTLNSGVGLAVLGNPNLSWESQQDINIGLDFSFLNNRLGGSIDVYERTIRDRIGRKSLMSYQEVNQMHYNTQRIDKTRGVDFSIYGSVSKNNFSWDSQFSLTWYSDFTTRRDPSEVLTIYQTDRYRWNDMWYYLSDGLVQPNEEIPHMPGALAGAVKIRDVNGFMRDESGNKHFDENGRTVYSGGPDGIIDEADMVNIGNNTPIPFSWTNSFRYKGFDLNIGIYGKFNAYKSNDKIGNISFSGMDEGSNNLIYYKDHYTFDNLDSRIPGFAVYETTFWMGDYIMEKAWFVRLENVTLGYTLPKSVTKNWLNSVRFYASMKNLCTITPYKGYDPEYDVFGYPLTSAFTFGVDLKF